MFPKSILIATLIATINAHSPYEDCGPNGENCFAVPPFESDVATCLAAQVQNYFRREIMNRMIMTQCIRL